MDGMQDSDDGDRVRGTDSDEDLSGSDIDSARERANESKLTIDTKKSAEPEREIGDQKTIDIEGGPIFDQKIAVDDRLFMARVAEQGGRHEEAIEFLIDFFRKKDEQKVRVQNKPQPIEADYLRAERNFVQIAFKNVIGPKRVVVRTLHAILENPKYARYNKRINDYRHKVEDEIVSDCSYFLDMLHSYCIDRKGNGAETETFFLTVAADLTRYICEVTDAGQKLKDLKDNCNRLYERAQRKSERLHYCSQTKMCMDLHYANFVNEFMNDTSKALKICEVSVAMCQATIHTCDEEAYVEANHLSDLLKENMAIWRGEDPATINQPNIGDM